MTEAKNIAPRFTPANERHGPVPSLDELFAAHDLHKARIAALEARLNRVGFLLANAEPQS